MSRAVLDGWVGALDRARSGQARQDYDSRLTSGPYPEMWAMTRDNLQAALTQFRQIRKVNTGSSRAFTGIVVEKGTQRLGVPGGDAGRAAQMVLNDPAFAGERCALVGFDITQAGEDSGHAAAVWRQTGQNETYYFLDPNYGIYAGVRDKLKDAIA